MTHSVYWTAKKLAQRLALIEPLVYRQSVALAPFRYQTIPLPEDTPPIGTDVDDSQWERLHPNTYWAGWLTNFILRNDIQIPTDWDASIPVAIRFRLGVSHDFSHPEALTYIDGVPYAACDRHHYEILLPDRLRDGQSHLIALHGWTGLGGWGNGQEHTRLFAETSELVQIDQPTRDFIAVARVTLGMANVIDADQPQQARLLTLLDEAFKRLDIREPFGDNFYASVADATTYLRDGLATIGEPMDVDIFAAGHAHIDVVWLWTLGQVRRKAGRTFHTVMRLMEQFPDYRFTQSQPQLYDYVRQDYPELFEDIKQRVAEGKWETIGGMWVEADCNLTGNESLARQFLLGRTFFREHFGVDSPILWLPDVFGYAWNLPQLIKQAGLEYFFTIKIGWSQYNRLPYDSFWWQGLDGTKVLTHFSPTPDMSNSSFASTYNAAVTPEQVMGTWTNFRQKDLRGTVETPPTLMSYGWGDGGGGPTREMLENLRELKAFPGTPRMIPSSAHEFFKQLAKLGDFLPTWNGELYLEYHRGTYTTQSRNKRGNRKSEFLLHDAEFLASYAALMDGGYDYPAETLRKAWELVCLNQFHDIIPGSSIEEAYVESQQQYAHIHELGEGVKQAALKSLASYSGGDVIIANPSSFDRYDLVTIEGVKAGATLQRADGTPVEIQATADGKVLVDPGKLAPFSITPLRYASEAQAQTENTLTAEPTLLENAYVRVELNSDGDITRIYDKANQRDVLPSGAIANQWQVFEDRPMDFDAWDIDIFYDDKMWLAEPATSVKVVESGPLRATLEIERRILNSTYTQRVSLVHDSARLDFDTHIDWQEKHILLKTAFPVDVFSPVATYEIQWGNVQRSTHRNSSWDWARFETCAQKWVDLSEGNYGVSLLNDCKYGHDIQNNIMRLTLLRSPTFPDKHADEGEHRFAYSLLPHVGGWNETTAREAYALNDPLIAQVVEPSPSVDATALGSLIGSANDNVMIETVKRAEDGNGLIVRFYEFKRERGTVSLNCRFNLGEAWRTNLIEDDQEQIIVEGNQINLFLKPYEIVTLRLIPQQ
ncbi:MAG: alpha-mannosidase [Chloroflexi bacterium]|nr:alpha-mannosidase [Chloroflexota bacterium]MCC6891595.1 alpha-mannosidase [Anaerolineae bacterium]